METSTHMTWAFVFAVMLIDTAVVFPNTNAMPTIEAEDKRESNFATRDVNFPLQDVSSCFHFAISHSFNIFQVSIKTFLCFKTYNWNSRRLFTISLVYFSLFVFLFFVSGFCFSGDFLLDFIPIL